MATQSNSEENMKALGNQVDTLCPECGESMTNLGNVSNIVLASWPPQWDETFVCYKDKTKRTVRVRADLPKPMLDLDSFTEVTDLQPSDGEVK